MAIQIRFKAVKENKKNELKSAAQEKKKKKAYFLQSTNLCLKEHFLLRMYHTILMHLSETKSEKFSWNQDYIFTVKVKK